MHSLAVQVIAVAGRVVQIPGAVKVVHLRRPEVAAPGRVAVGVDDLWRGRLEAVDAGGAAQLEVCPGGGDEVVVTAGVGYLGVAAARVADGVGEGLAGADEAQEAEGKSTKLHFLFGVLGMVTYRTELL